MKLATSSKAVGRCASGLVSHLQNFPGTHFSRQYLYVLIRQLQSWKIPRTRSLIMDQQRSDHLIACLPERNPNLSFHKRKRKKSFRIMEELLEIEGTHRPERDTHDMANETRRATGKDANQQLEIISSVMERAEGVQAKLKTKFPSFVKPMIRSNIAGGFWLSLPKLFCKLHLPIHNICITLVDESHKEYYTKYLPERRGLSAGWKGFSISHNLEEGDVLVFHLVGVWKMKVYIVRAKHFGEADAALGLLQLQAHSEVADSEHLRRRVGTFHGLDKYS